MFLAIFVWTEYVICETKWKRHLSRRVKLRFIIWEKLSIIIRQFTERTLRVLSLLLELLLLGFAFRLRCYCFRYLLKIYLYLLFSHLIKSVDYRKTGCIPGIKDRDSIGHYFPHLFVTIDKLFHLLKSWFPHL